MMKAVCGRVLRAPFTTIAEPVKFVKCMDRMKDFPRAAARPKKNTMVCYDSGLYSAQQKRV